MTIALTLIGIEELLYVFFFQCDFWIHNQHFQTSIILKNETTIIKFKINSKMTDN